MRKDHDMLDREYIIQIYHSPVEIGFVVPGKERLLKEIAFLDKITGWPSAAGIPRSTPDTVDGYYVLDDEQYELYLSFRERLSSDP